MKLKIFKVCLTKNYKSIIAQSKNAIKNIQHIQFYNLGLALNNWVI